jgi:hypothetical protein
VCGNGEGAEGRRGKWMRVHIEVDRSRCRKEGDVGPL